LGQHQGNVQIVFVKFLTFIISKISTQFQIILQKKIFFLFLFFGLIGCTAIKRVFNSENIENNFSSIRVLLNETSEVYKINVDFKLTLYDESGILAEVDKGNQINFSVIQGIVVCKITNQVFQSSSFQLKSDDEILKVNGKKFRGVLKIFERNSQIKVVNSITLEDYVKGVMTKEMPVGNGNENYEALKAFSICVRTYAVNKLSEEKDLFDIYPDTRDQVYGGIDGETGYTNDIVDETNGQILTYNDNLATIFYHSTCGGFTEDVKNVFGKESIPYLISVEDGINHYCKISPRYYWAEKYSEETFIERLYKSKLIENVDYTLADVEVNSKFNSGRVNELLITVKDKVGEEKSVSLFGNSLRSIIRTSDNKSILKSNYFDIILDENKNVIIEGKGSGHGVGMCQWGAIGQSHLGINYKEILDHYYPGTRVRNIYD
jgi:stage II sporulation protein D